MSKQSLKYKPYKVVGAYDSETTNIDESGNHFAFPVLHQLGMLSVDIQDVTSENVESVCNVSLYRHTLDLYDALDSLTDTEYPYVPVIACHNLAFDMYGLAQWLDTRQVRVLAKSLRKPLTFTILDNDGNPALVIWDTLTFTQKSLDYMGKACGYSKLSGAWDYDLIRTTDTPLTASEIAYASHDIYSLLCYIGYWCRLNPDINPCALARNVVTKTGIVRYRRVDRFSQLKGRTLKHTVGQYWYMLNKQNSFDSDDELFTCIASTRGGFTFVASKNASVPFDCAGTNSVIAGYDATSMHPSQIVTHFYPHKFKKATPEQLSLAFEITASTSIEKILARYYKPFTSAFYACFEVENLRIKKDSVFDRYGIAPFASARCAEYEMDEKLFEENQDFEEFRKFISDSGYKDLVENGKYEFGKLVKADRAILYMTELAAWEFSQAYDYDSVKGVSGYLTGKFCRASDMDVISVMNFYEAKNEFKHAIGMWKNEKQLDNGEKLVSLGIPEFVVRGMCDFSIDADTVESTYLGLKSDLNSLFGVNATNEYRRSTVLSSSGIEYVGEYGICNAPRVHKAFYQFGQRIVGWSRIAQILVMHLLTPCVDTVINGDTDSIKVLCDKHNLTMIDSQLSKLAAAIDKSKKHVCKRVKLQYPKYYSRLDGIGHYVKEFETEKFVASWNKAYMLEDNGELKLTVAGIPSNRGANQLATTLYRKRYSFADLANVFLGYNVTYAHNLIHLYSRKFPNWGDMFVRKVKDYTGSETLVCEPSSLCLYPMSKTVNDTGNVENAANMEIAIRNNPHVNIESCIIGSKGIYRV